MTDPRPDAAPAEDDELREALIAEIGREANREAPSVSADRILPIIAGIRQSLADMARQLAEAHEEIARLKGERDAVGEALRPSAITKAAYSGEIQVTVDCGVDERGEDITWKMLLPWTTIKDVMALIRARAVLAASSDGGERGC